MEPKSFSQEPNEPKSCPSKQEIMAALGTLDQQQLHIYQTLYFKGLTAPGGGTFLISRAVTSGRLNIFIEVKHARSGISFKVFDNLPDPKGNSLLFKCQSILDAVADKRKGITNACCILANYRDCVCRVSTDCILHGVICEGSHD